MWLAESQIKQALLHTLKRTASNKGWLLITDEFEVFCWNSDPILKQLLIAMASWADTGEGKCLEVKEDLSQKSKFVVEIRKDAKNKPIKERWIITESGFTCKNVAEQVENNPFL